MQVLQGIQVLAAMVARGEMLYLMVALGLVEVAAGEVVAGDLSAASEIQAPPAEVLVAVEMAVVAAPEMVVELQGGQEVAEMEAILEAQVL